MSWLFSFVGFLILLIGLIGSISGPTSEAVFRPFMSFIFGVVSVVLFWASYIMDELEQKLNKANSTSENDKTELKAQE